MSAREATSAPAQQSTHAPGAPASGESRSAKPVSRPRKPRASAGSGRAQSSGARAPAAGTSARSGSATGARGGDALTRADYWGVLAPIFKRVPKYVRLAWSVLRSPSIPRRHKSMLYVTLVYTFSPLHMLAGPIPVVAQVDSLVLLLLGIRQALAHAPAEKVDQWMDRYDLDPGQMERDLHVATYTAWRALGGISAPVRHGLASIATPVAREARFLVRIARGFGGRVLARVHASIQDTAETR